MDMSRQEKRGFTLVELLVVIAIIGILVALLLPAVQSAREAARRMQCSNNLKQLGLALHNYHTAFNRFPMGAVNYPPYSFGGPKNDNHGSFLIALLPFIEQQNLYDACDFSTDTAYNSEINGKKVHEVWVSTFLCPSDEGQVYQTGGNPLYSSTTNLKLATSNYGASMGNQKFNPPCNFQPNMFGGGSATHGHSEDGLQISGVFSHTAWGAAISDIRDGTSNTIAIGEIRPRCSWHARDGWMHVNSLWFATTCPINHNNCPDSPNFDAGCAGDSGAWACDMGFKSRHVGGALFAFADGSVQFLTENIDYVTYQKLGARRDGEVVGQWR